MTMKRGFEEIIELATDPLLDASYIVNEGTRWLDTGSTPSLLKERNAGNTAWNIVGVLGRHTETFTATAAQTTKVLTYTPASRADISVQIDGWAQSNSNLTNLTGKTVTFTALTLGMEVTMTYTRLD